MTDKTIFGDMSEEQIRAEAGMGAKSTPSYIYNLRITNNHKDKITRIKSHNIWVATMCGIKIPNNLSMHLLFPLDPL